jgi:HEAT repeats
LSGCGSSISDSTAQGPVDRSLHRDAVLDNRQRLAGEDHRVVPLYKTPLEALGVGLDGIFVRPWAIFFDYISHDSPAYAARKMEDPNSPDLQREGMLRLADFAACRRGIYIKGYAHFAKDTEDYTVRAAAIRALNRCRATGYTSLFLEAINDDQPLVRLEAADALGNIPDPTAIPLLELHMGDIEPSLDVRVACADALRNYHTAEVMHALVGELNDQEFALAWQARQSLELLTAQDFRYDQKAWLNYLANIGT